MTVFATSLNQTALLLIFIITGYILSRWKIVPENSPAVLANLEKTILIPALVLSTFLNSFTPQMLSEAAELLLAGTVFVVICIVFSFLCARFLSKDPYERNVFAYGLIFPNYGYMGNAVVMAVFPQLFLEYILFTLPLWIMTYVWGISALLLKDGSAKPTWKQRLKDFFSPMLISVLLGGLLSLLQIPVPQFVKDAVTSAGDCVSPLAMLLSGMILAKFPLGQILGIKRVYLVTALRLIVFPGLFLLAMTVVPFPETIAICAVCVLSMPLGMNTVIFPSAYGKDTRVASGMVLVSHVLSCLTIPVIFLLMESLLK